MPVADEKEHDFPREHYMDKNFETEEEFVQSKQFLDNHLGNDATSSGKIEV